MGNFLIKTKEFVYFASKSYSRQIRRLPFVKLFYFALGCSCAMGMFALVQNARSRRNEYPFMIRGMRLNQGHPFFVWPNQNHMEQERDAGGGMEVRPARSSGEKGRSERLK